MARTPKRRIGFLGSKKPRASREVGKMVKKIDKAGINRLNQQIADARATLRKVKDPRIRKVLLQTIAEANKAKAIYLGDIRRG